MKGNDLVEHIQKCISCQELQDEIDEIGQGDLNEVMLLVDKQIECLVSKVSQVSYFGGIEI
jgi:hypothetical protein